MYNKEDYENPKPSRIRSAKAAKRHERHSRKMSRGRTITSTLMDSYNPTPPRQRYRMV